MTTGYLPTYLPTLTRITIIFGINSDSFDLVFRSQTWSINLLYSTFKPSLTSSTSCPPKHPLHLVFISSQVVPLDLQRSISINQSILTLWSDPQPYHSTSSSRHVSVIHSIPSRFECNSAEVNRWSITLMRIQRAVHHLIFISLFSNYHLG